MPKNEVFVTQDMGGGTITPRVMGGMIDPTTVSQSQVLPLKVSDQGEIYTVGSSTTPTATKMADSPSIDAFARTRTSEPVTLFDSKQTTPANNELFWDISGSGAASSSYEQVRASTYLTVTSGSEDRIIRQTKQYFNYQPGKSMMILLTAVADTPQAGVSQIMGYYDDNNGIYCEISGSDINWVIRSNVTGTPVETRIAQADWNVDTFDGSGTSGYTLDPTKAQIAFIDFEWLGVGRVRAGFVFDGIPYYAHYFLHSNNINSVYMSTPNLPLRYEIVSDGTNAADATLEAICCSVASEGGMQDLGILRYGSTGGDHVNANVADTIYAVLGIKLKSDYVGVTVKELVSSLLSETSDDFEWMLLLNPTITGTFTYNDVANSAVQIASGSAGPTIAAGNLGTPLNGGFVSTTNQGGGDTLAMPNAIHLGKTLDGTLDEFVLAVRPLSADADIQASMTWRELL